MMNWLSRLAGRKRPKPAPPSLAELQAAFPFELNALPAREALEAYFALQHEVAASGRSPLLLSDYECVQRITENCEPHGSSQGEILKRAADIDVNQWFAERKLEYQTWAGFDLGEWLREPSPNNELRVLYVPSSGRLRETLYLATVPTPHSWAIPAYLGFGGWNDCPESALHVALAKYWHDHFGAHLAATQANTLEFVVERPPQDREAAEKLAQEQYLYCYDIVVQGSLSIRNLAGSLLHGQVWYFWWD